MGRYEEKRRQETPAQAAETGKSQAAQGKEAKEIWDERLDTQERRKRQNADH
jgi:hypothetical protein